MIAIACGLAAAVSFAISTLCATRASRLIGPAPVLAWVAVVGLALTAGIATAQRPVPTAPQAGWLAIAGLGNAAGLVLEYMAVRSQKVGVVAPIISTEGGIAAAIAVLAGERLPGTVLAALAAVAVGAVLVAWPAAGDRSELKGNARGSALASGAAIVFGLSIYATGHVAALPVGWVVVPPRIAGVAFVALPLAIGRRLKLTRSAAPLVAAAAVCEVTGFAAYTFGARQNIAVTAVIASLFASLAAIGAYVLFSERLGRAARIGIVIIAAGTGVVAAIHL
jgi:drug/metabolite transporter (DMT)-like permease